MIKGDLDKLKLVLYYIIYIRLLVIIIEAMA